MPVCMCVCRCTYNYMYVYIHVFMFEYINYVCMYACTCLCILVLRMYYICLYACLYVRKKKKKTLQLEGRCTRSLSVGKSLWKRHRNYRKTDCGMMNE
jgi:hypothetical protein